jgi:hypothetical protein
MKTLNETTVRSYQVSGHELMNALKLKGTVKSVKWENDILTIQTMDDNKPIGEKIVNSILDNIEKIHF